VLVVDDDMMICELLATVLHLNGYQVKFKLSGEEAIKILDKEDFHVVITDLKMGTVDGHAVVRHAKRLQSETLLIMMTGYCDERNKQQALNNGADYFLCKPIDMEELLQKLPTPGVSVNSSSVLEPVRK